MNLKVIFIFLMITSSFTQTLNADLICYDGETPLTDVRPPAGPMYNCWWNTCPGDNNFVDTNFNSYQGTNCGIWRCDADWSGGALQVDPGWAGINVTTMTSFEFRVRGKNGGEGLKLQLFDMISEPNRGYTKFIDISALSTSWTRYSYSLYSLTNGFAGKHINLEKFEGIRFSDAWAGTSVFFDDMIIKTCGISEKVFLDGDISKSSSHPKMVWAGIATIIRTNYKPHSGSYCEKLTGSGNAQLGVFNETWAKWDVSGNLKFEFWIRGDVGNEAVKIYLYGPAGANVTKTMDLHWSKGFTITTNWQFFSTTIYGLTNGAGQGFDIKQFSGVEFEWYVTGGTIYIDDMKFSKVGVLSLSEPKATPSIISNNKINQVAFTVNVSSLAAGGGTGAPVGCIINLSSINGPSNAVMTNISGNLYRYTFATPYGFNRIGENSLFVKATNTEGLTKTTNINLKVINAIVPVLSDEKCEPSVITNTTDKQVVFSLKAVSLMTDGIFFRFRQQKA